MKHPFLIFCPKCRRAFALHAGWLGRRLVMWGWKPRICPSCNLNITEYIKANHYQQLGE